MWTFFIACIFFFFFAGSLQSEDLALCMGGLPKVVMPAARMVPVDMLKEMYRVIGISLDENWRVQITLCRRRTQWLVFGFKGASFFGVRRRAVFTLMDGWKHGRVLASCD